MTTTLHRPLSLKVAAAVAVLAAAFAVVAGSRTEAHAAHSHGTATLTAKQVAFHDGMRKLWEDHITWTRLAIVDLAAGSPSTNATVARLLRNQVDIGNAIKPFYGAAAGTKLTALLKQHILIAADVINAAKSGNSADVTAAQRRWTANANQIVAFLHGANPHQWSTPMLKAMMLTHLALTTREAVAWLNHDWAASAANYDNVHREILAMADMLSTGIERQFPARFR
jgi:hypothetical protein